MKLNNKKAINREQRTGKIRHGVFKGGEPAIKKYLPTGHNM